jgi:hypothetical protein
MGLGRVFSVHLMLHIITGVRIISGCLLYRSEFFHNIKHQLRMQNNLFQLLLHHKISNPEPIIDMKLKVV